ncbi:MAG: S-layer homology domain-containing protein, partial [Firmicutes bacterium]|nr:S-layer homology domain-containing protein [Bacillota bacterium]
MKKVLSFVLVLCMILGSFGMAFAAPADVVGTDYEDAVTALTELGVVAGYKDGSFKPANIVTRAEMATFLIKALGLNDYAVGKSAFADMAGHWADPYVAYAADLGFIKGNTDGTFAPDVTVSYDQAITMVVQALGYKADYLIGSYPGAFVNKAKALGILDGIVSGVAGANRGDIAQLIYNALDEQIVRYDNDGRTTNEGTMRARLTGVAGDATIREGYVITGSEDAVIDAMDYQGAYVDYYLNKDGDIAAIKEVKSVFLTGTVEETVSTSALTSGGAVKFVVDETKYTVDAAAFVPVNVGRTTASSVDVNFVNGRTGSITELVKDNEYVIAAKVSGKTIKEIYSIAEWSANATYQWDADAMVEDLEEDFKIDTYEFEDNDNKEIDTTKFVLVGVDSLDDLKKNDVVTVYQGGRYITKVEVCRDVVEGTITEVKSDKVVINGKDYKEDSASLTIGSGDLALDKE